MDFSTETVLFSGVRVLHKVHDLNGVFVPKSERGADMFSYVSCGRLIVSDGNEELTVSSGELLFLPKGAKHSTRYYCENGICEMFNLYFDSCPRSLSDKAEKLTASPKVSAHIEAVTDYCDGHAYISQAYCLSALYWLIFLLGEKTVPEEYQKISAAAAYIEKNYRKNIRNSELAKAATMSESGFRKLFSEYTGISPVEYRNRVRMLRTEALIADGVPVSVAAFECGFCSVSFYYRLKRRKNTSK